jgi:hypothetical protein
MLGRLPQALYVRLSGAATHPAGARPSKCIIRPVGGAAFDNDHVLRHWTARTLPAQEPLTLTQNPSLGIEPFRSHLVNVPVRQ